MAKVPYSNAIKSLIYTMTCTNVDIWYVVGLVSEYQSNCGQKHYHAIKGILAYLKGIADYYLFYQEGNLLLIEYLDVD